MPNSINDLGDINSLESLSLDCACGIGGCTSMSGIEKFPELYILNIANCDISDINKIGEIKKLEHLCISGVYCITDISFLKNNTTLKELSLIDLPFESIKDISVISTLPNLTELIVDVGESRISSVEQYKEMMEFFSADEPKMENSNTENTEKTSTETKSEPNTETKKQPEKPTRIPQAGVNVVGNAISILVAVSAVILAIAFVKAKRK